MYICITYVCMYVYIIYAYICMCIYAGGRRKPLLCLEHTYVCIHACMHVYTFINLLIKMQGAGGRRFDRIVPTQK
jgi:hypothetical protein